MCNFGRGFHAPGALLRAGCGLYEWGVPDDPILHCPPPAPTSFTHRETVVILAGLMLGFFLAALDQTIVATALPRMAADLHGIEHLSWVVSAYLLTSTAATPIYGKLSDLYGRKVMLDVAIVIFLLTSVLCALASSMSQLIVFRALQGLGAGGLISMCHAVIADVISPRERGSYQAYIAGAFFVAALTGPVVGGLFADYLTWRWIFWINLPIGSAALYMSHRTLRGLTVTRVKHRIDYVGAVLIVAAVCCVLIVTTSGGKDLPWDSGLIKLLIGASIVLFVLCVIQERTTSEPILPPRLFSNRTFVVANIINALTSLIMLGAIILVPLFLQLVFGLPATNSGLLLIPLTGTMSLAAIFAGRRIARTGRYKIFPAVGMLFTATCLGSLALVDADTPLALTSLIIAGCGIGVGLVGPVMMVAVQNAVQGRDLGTATSSISFFRSLGGSFGVALFSAVLIARLNNLLADLPGHEALGDSPGLQLLRAGRRALAEAPEALQASVAGILTSAFHTVFTLGSALAVICFIAVLFLKEVPLSTTPVHLDRK
jgi:EmrB/QacA subfamily drug resistance transporter